jgi:hypothetical protein
MRIGWLVNENHFVTTSPSIWVPDPCPFRVLDCSTNEPRRKPTDDVGRMHRPFEMVLIYQPDNFACVDVAKVPISWFPNTCIFVLIYFSDDRSYLLLRVCLSLPDPWMSWGKFILQWNKRTRFINAISCFESGPQEPYSDNLKHW